MAWTSPRTWTAGELVTAAIMNTHIRDNEGELRAGGIAIASQATGDFLFASSATQFGRLAVGSAFQTVRRNSANNAYEFARPWSPRVTSVASGSAPTPNIDTTDLYEVTALAEPATFGAPTGTVENGQVLTIRIKDNGTARALAWNAAYAQGGVALPTTTTISRWLHLQFIRNPTAGVWQLVASALEV